MLYNEIEYRRKKLPKGSLLIEIAKKCFDLVCI